MLQSVLLILLIIGGFWVAANIRRKSPDERRRLIWRCAVTVLVLLLLLLVATGRMHWLFALIGALLPFIRPLLGIGVQLLPLWLRRKHSQTHQQSSAAPPPVMDVQEALDILGLKGNIASGDITSTMINDAHRRLIQKMHPDRGGSDYLAAKINRARDLLLTMVKKT